MHVVSPARYRPRTKRRRRWPFVAISLLLISLAGVGNYARPLPMPTATARLAVPTISTEPTLAWPSVGQAAVAADGYGALGTAGSQTPLATASIAKVILALCVLQKQPLSIGQTGPTYTINAADVTLYQNEVAHNGSALPVVIGEQLTEYQALQALMLPSANNIANSLANWQFGGHTEYAGYATTYLAQHNLTHTTIGSDASGFDPSTMSTASDLTQIGLLALQNPTLMQIAGQPTAVLPIAGTVYNYDTILGQNGITGLKTGNSAEDPGAFLFTATTHVGTTDVRLSGSIMGAADLDNALRSSTQLVSSVGRGFEEVEVASADQVIGSLHTAWGQNVPLKTTASLRVVRWKSVPINQTDKLSTNLRSGTIGTITVTAGHAQDTTNVRLAHSVAGPSFWWRLTRH